MRRVNGSCNLTLFVLAASIGKHITQRLGSTAVNGQRSSRLGRLSADLVWKNKRHFFSPSFARRLLVKRLGRNTTSYSRSQNITMSRSVVDSDKTGGWMKMKMAYRHDSYAKWWALETESSRYALLTLNYNHTKWNFRSPPWGCGISTFVPFWLGFDELCLSVCLSLSSTNSTTHQSLEKITKILFSHESSILMICETRWKVSSLCRS